MATKTSTAHYDGVGLQFTARTGSGHEIVLDDGAGNAGPRPVEMLLVGQAGCTAMDVMSILQKKRQVVTSYEVSVTAEQRDTQPAVYTRADVLHVVEGPALDEAAVRRRLLLEHGIEISGGLGPLAGRAWRIGVMGVGAELEPQRRLVEALAALIGETRAGAEAVERLEAAWA